MYFAVTPSGGYIEYDVDPALGLLTYGAYGVANGYIVGGGGHASMESRGLLYDYVTQQWFDVGNYNIFAVGPNGRVGGSKENGAFAADVDNGQWANMTTISPPQSATGMTAFAVSGNVTVGFTSVNGGNLQVAVADGTTYREMQRGAYSVGYSYDPISQLVGGVYNNYAATWNLDGSVNLYANPDGSGYLSGKVSSIHGGLGVIETYEGDLYVAYQDQVQSISLFLAGLGVSANPSNAWFVGDAVTTALVFPGSIHLFQSDPADLARAGGFDVSDDNGETAVPEPGTWALAAAGIALLLFRKRQTGAVRSTGRALLPH